MVRAGHSWVFVILLILIAVSISACCMNRPDTRITPVDMGSTFLDHASGIRDYRSEYISTTDGTVQFDWKSPGLYRMEYTGSPSVSPGIQTRNQTTAVWYDSRSRTVRVEPDNRNIREHDYQAMVRQIVGDGKYTIKGTDTQDGHTVYEIEVRTEPWSMNYTTYVSSKVQAWIDPETGLAWEIITYYPADTVNNRIRYSRIETNTGISDDYFMLIHPEGSAVACGYSSGPADAENFNPNNLPPALEPGCLDCTDALLTRPVGGFNGDRLRVSLIDYQAGGRTLRTDPSRSVNYTFYARAMQPGNVRYTVSRVAGLYRTEPEPMPENITVLVEPGEFLAEPGHTYLSTVTAHVKPGTVLKENFWIHIHADVEGVPDAITDDWVRLALDDGSLMSGMGLYHFYQGGGGYCQKVLVIRPGEEGHLPFAIRNSELDTGNVTLGLVTSPCIVDHGPLRPDERPVWPEGIHAAITPDQFTGRSFASYLPDMAFTVDPAVPPGDYCFSAVLRTPTGGSDYVPFTLRVVPADSPPVTTMPAPNKTVTPPVSAGPVPDPSRVIPTTAPGKNLTVPTPFNFAPDEISNPDLIARIALTDSSARRMVEAGGEVAGVRMAVKRSARANADDGGVFPALLIRYNGLEAEFMVDTIQKKTIGRTIQVPSGTMILEKGNKTSIEYYGSVLFTFDPMEGSS
ncbi:outer membrane lipoprotein carrier protein LolA [Methanoregula sp.]|uniref:LolA family protein n=1 Tax=Methanoregula sp. TaxID=2052170 RepID=UPI00356B3C16